MEKVNIVFHNNGTVSYQHRKILNFVPEMSKDGDLRLVVPNIPLLVSSQCDLFIYLLSFLLNIFEKYERIEILFFLFSHLQH